MMGSLTSEGKWSVIAVVTSVCAVFGANSQGDNQCVYSLCDAPGPLREI